jgi:hypothetical protein
METCSLIHYVLTTLRLLSLGMGFCVVYSTGLHLLNMSCATKNICLQVPWLHAHACPNKPSSTCCMFCALAEQCLHNRHMDTVLPLHTIGTDCT